MLGSAQADAFCAKAARDARVARSVGVGAHAEGANLVGPAEQLGVRLKERGLGAREGPVRHPHYFARDCRQIPCEDAAGRAIERQPVALRDVGSVDAEGFALEIDMNVLAADDGAFPHSPRDDGGVTRHASTRGEYRARRDDAVEILGCGLIADQNHALAGKRALRSRVGVEYRAPTRGARARGKTDAERCRTN